jgi:cytochrome b involved in lipid metabolism
MSKQLSTKEVATHKTVEEGLWIIIDSEVYDVTKFIDEHPGGPKILKRVAGKDASKQFWKVRLPPSFQHRGLVWCGFRL